MGMAAYARRIAETESEVRYELRHSIDAAPSSVMVIHKSAPAHFSVVGDSGTETLARAVMAKLLRSVRENDAWPRFVQHVAG